MLFRAVGIKPLMASLRAPAIRSSVRSSVFKCSIATVKSSDAEENDLLRRQRINRPESPHLEIYQPQLTWVLSGLHRITGVFLAAGFYGITCTYALASFANFDFDATSIYQTIQDLPLALKYTARAALAYPFVFHFANGIRHYSWDLGKGFSIAAIYRSGYIVLGTTAILGTWLTFMS